MSEDHDDLELQFPEIRLPEPGDRVFGPDGRFHETACILGESWWGHAMSYKETADIVVRHALGDTGSLDFVILPVCFLYRHYLELALKALAQDVAKVLDEEPPKLMDHNLNTQWLFVRRFFGEQRDEIQATDALLQEWMSYDRGSYSFRYPTTPKGEPSLPSTLTHLNIRRIAETVDKIDTLFTGMADYLGNAIDAMNDAMADAMADAISDEW